MKFVCENCKAKYQIGDEKVAGKTVRMKCRRCGYMIQVSSSVTESSVSKRMPTRPPAPAGGGTARGVRAPGVPKPPRASRPEIPKPTKDDEATSIMMTPPTGLGAGGRKAPPPPRPTPAAAAAQAAAGLAAPAAGSRPSTPGAMANAFSQAVSAPPAAPSMSDTPADDWYVGVGGVPLGPVRLSVIREKAASGAVDGDSLVWREGYDEWQPLKNFPSLLELITEAASKPAGRRTFTPAPMAAPSAPFNLVRQSRPPAPATQTPTPSPARASEPGPEPAAAAAAAAAAVTDPSPGVIPAAADSAPSLAALGAAGASATESSPGLAAGAAPGLGAAGPAGGPVGVLSDPFAAPTAPPADKSEVKTNGAAAAVVLGGATSDVAPPGGAPPESVGPSPESIIAGKHKKRGLHPMAYAFIAMAAAFGAVVAYKFVLGPKEIVVLGQNNATGEAAAPGAHAPPPPPEGATGGDPPASGETPAPEDGNPDAVAAGGPRSGGGTPGAPASGDEKGDKPGKTGDGSQSSFDTGVGGPSEGPSGSGADSKGSGQLSEGEIMGVVNRNTPRIRRKCWEPAFRARSNQKQKSTTVRVSITIGGSGNVQSASASGGSGFPGLASCVQSSVGAWRFPTSGGTSRANIPFSFISQ